ncbi:MAG: hypothetical protein CV087_16670 [Candidatus Brocadia sp. WS118]|nr:MAG: hypothetical protein CV087_16670 [Candidatus Brocadia sp. WS118]
MENITSEEERFLARALAVVEKRLPDNRFNNETLAQEVGMSRVQLNGKLQTLLGQDGSEFIMAARLRRAAEFLREEGATVSAVAARTGFKSAGSFARCFKQRYGCRPADYGTTERR